MTFNSVEFFVFGAAVIALYWRLGLRGQTALLFLASYIFYGWWDVRFLLLLFGTTVVDYAVGLALGREQRATRRRQILTVSVVANLGVLAFFKYFGFFTDSARELFEAVGWNVDPAFIDVLLPVGISFYTFQSMSYTIDVYRRRVEPCPDFLQFAVYVAYFPQLVAGPIERAQHLLPQITSPRRRPSAEQVETALMLILMGLVRKVVIADAVAPVVNRTFAEAGAASGPALVVGAVAFGLQIYGDFAGYTDIARGTSRLMGIELMHNFRQPYLSRNITEFWRRWHISLSTWLRDYLYVPIGGNRGSAATTVRNIMVVMLLGGLWHGAAWTFVAWGGIHGALLVAHRLMRGGRVRGIEDAPWGPGAVASAVVTYSGVHLAWIFFRADSFSQAADFLGGIITWRAGDVVMADFALVMTMLLLGLAVDLGQRTMTRPLIPSRAPALAGSLAAVMTAAILVNSGRPFVPFIYFQF